jgi:hypothetical protein
MAGFVQIIEYTTARPDEVRAMGEEWRRTRGDDPQGPARLTLVADRDHPGHYLSIVEFDSYEAAMANSQREDTSDFAARMAALCDAPPTFRNLDVMDRWENAAP